MIWFLSLINTLWVILSWNIFWIGRIILFFFLRGGGNIALTIFAHTFPFCHGCSYFRYLGMGVMVNETCLFRHYYWIVSLILTGSRIQNSTMADWLICFLRLINPFCFFLFCFLEREYCINISFFRTTMLFFPDIYPTI